MPKASIFDIDNLEKRVSSLENSGGANVALADEISENGESAVKSSGIYKHIHNLEADFSDEFNMVKKYGHPSLSGGFMAIRINPQTNNYYEDVSNIISKSGELVSVDSPLYLKSVTLKTSSYFALLAFKNDVLVAISDYVWPYSHDGYGDVVTLTFSGDGAFLAKDDPSPLVIVASQESIAHNLKSQEASYESQYFPPLAELYDKYMGKTLKEIKDMGVNLNIRQINCYGFNYDSNQDGLDVFGGSDGNFANSVDDFYWDGDSYNPHINLNFSVKATVHQTRSAIYLTEYQKETLQKLLAAADSAINE